MEHSAEFRRCLAELDVAGMRALWKHVSPHLEQPKTDHETLASLHMARTQAESMPLKLRAYSHRWLLDNGYPSQLPDQLKPRAERLYPVIVEAVGIAVCTRSPLLAPISGQMREAMETAVLESYADGIKDPNIIRKRMSDAKATTVSRLLGIKS